ncbi:unnamed protein product [Linum trigynum]
MLATRSRRRKQTPRKQPNVESKGGDNRKTDEQVGGSRFNSLLDEEAEETETMEDVEEAEAETETTIQQEQSSVSRTQGKTQVKQAKKTPKEKSKNDKDEENPKQHRTPQEGNQKQSNKTRKENQKASPEASLPPTKTTEATTSTTSSLSTTPKQGSGDKKRNGDTSTDPNQGRMLLSSPRQKGVTKVKKPPDEAIKGDKAKHNVPKSHQDCQTQRTANDHQNEGNNSSRKITFGHIEEATEKKQNSYSKTQNKGASKNENGSMAMAIDLK